MKKINNFMIAFSFLTAIIWAMLNPSCINFSRILVIISILPVIYIPRILNKFFSLKIDKKTELIYILFIFFAQILGSVLRFYQTVPYYDKFIHFISGFLSCTFALVIIKKYHLQTQKLSFRNLLILLMSLAVAVGWEMFEYTSDKILKGDTQNVLTTGVNDTMQDVIMAFLASLFFIIFYSFKERRK